MTALAQGGAGVALVLCLGLLATRQVATITVLLGVQALAVAASAAAREQLVLAGLTLLGNGVTAVCLLRRQAPGFDGTAPPLGGAKFGILAGALLAALCQTKGAMAEPLAVILLSLLLAATRRHALLHLAGLISLQNGLALAAAMAEVPPLAALPGFLPALPYAAALVEDRLRADRHRLSTRLRPMLGWTQVAIVAVLLVGTMFAPSDPIGRSFAPLVAAWGLASAWSRRRRRLRLADRLADLLKLAAMLVAVSVSAPVVSLVALAIAMAAAMLPTVRRRLDDLLLGCCGVGLTLFGLLTLPLEPGVVPAAALLFGLAAMVAVVPALGAPVLVLPLRLSVHGAVSGAAAALLTAVSVAGLLACAVVLLSGPARLAPMRLAQTALIALVLSLHTPSAAFTAAVLLILLLLSDAAVLLARADGDRLAAAAATAALAGLPPLGLFPGVVLAAIRLAATSPWLLAPAGLALAATMRAALPARWPPPRRALPSLAWLPLLVALGFGYAAPDALLSWLRSMTGASP
ncbi:MAG: hypothetical protein JSS43_07430 [Proteobacteria bacterium]|nr:hypothetical protein [Pseudomonadota bacterium]